MNINPPPIKLLMIGNKKLEYYKDLLIKADTGLHHQLFSIINQLFKDRKDIKILDVACGEGAFASRLFDTGFKNVNCVDIDSHNFKFSGRINFTEIDLNNYSDVSHFVTNNAGEYDLVIGMETIEHLENPWLYIHMLKTVLKKDGVLILTTPNINSIYSKIIYILRDRFFLFMESNLSYYHINPISTFEIETICKYNDLNIVEIYPGGTYPIIWIKRNDLLFSFLYSMSNIFFYPFAKGQKFGWCNIYICKRVENQEF